MLRFLTPCTLFLAGLASLNASSGPPPAQTLHYIPHTHWEGAVFKTREGYLQMGLPHIHQAIELLKKQTNYTFTLDQVAYFKPFLERYPEDAALFRKFVREGRLEIVGGMDVMPDVVKPGGELFIRQMQYGKNFCREELGVDVKVAWLVDTFGHHPQMPQLLRQAGFTSFWFCRGVPKDDIKSEFLWQGIDGTKMPSVWIPGFYGHFYGAPGELPAFSKFFSDRFKSLDSHVSGPERVGLAGVDVCEPEPRVAPLVTQFNAMAGVPFHIRFSTPSEFAKVAFSRPNLPVLTNDLNPIFPGTYSSRIELKQRTRQIESLLLTAEKLQGIAAILGRRADTQRIWDAWEPVLFNQTHDLASGVMTDTVYEDTQRGYDFAEKLGGELANESWRAIEKNIDTSGAGIPVVLFNPLSWPRTDLVELDLAVPDGELPRLAAEGPGHARHPLQLLAVRRSGNGRVSNVRVGFVASDIPPLGFSTYHLVPAEKPLQESDRRETDGMENEFFRLKVDRATGAILSLFDKRIGKEMLSGPANVITRQLDKGDLWELYHGLNGASYIAGTTVQPVPKTGEAEFSNEFSAKPGTLQTGPVVSEFEVGHPFGKGSFRTRIRLIQGVPRIDIETELVNQEKYVRYQALFPTAVQGGVQTQEIPFGSIQRPNGIEFPAQNWVDFSGKDFGVTLVNQGMPGNLVSGNTMMLSLLRSHNLGAYGFGGGYEPGMSSETGFEIGTPRTLRYALVPHAGDWKSARVFHHGFDFNHPLLAVKTTSHPGKLPASWSLISISNPAVLLTALQPARNGDLLLRLSEQAGNPARDVSVHLNFRSRKAELVNFMDDPQGPVAKNRSDLRLDFHPFEIKTIRLADLGAAEGRR